MRTTLNKITLSGEVASGKSTVGKLLADKLGYQFTSIGNKTRRHAASEGMTIVEFQKKCLANPELDKQIDLDFSNDCNQSNNLIVGYRLGFKFIPNGFHVFLKISEEDAVTRLRNAKRINETHLTVHERNNSFKNQFIAAYGIDYKNEKHYDLIIKVKEEISAEEIVDIIHEKFKVNHK